MNIFNNTHGTELTFLLSTPHLVKSVTSKLYVKSDTSDKSGRIWHTESISGSTDRSSANSGCPLKPSGFFSLADITSLTPKSALPTLNESVEKEHWISDTKNTNKPWLMTSIIYGIIELVFIFLMSNSYNKIMGYHISFVVC